MPRITVFGLNMDDTIYTRIIAAIRGTYPELTAGLSDSKAAQSVLKIWAVGLVSSWERGQAATDPNDAARAAAEAATKLRQAALDRATTEVNADVQPTAT